MKIADLYAMVGLRPDARSVRKTDDMLNRAGRKLKQLAGSTFFQLAGGAALVLGTNNALNFADSIDALDIASRKALGSTDAITDGVLKLSDATGLTKESVVGASAEFIRLTGDADTAKVALAAFGEAAVATGADVKDVAGTGAALSQAFAIKGEDFSKAFSILIAGGKRGAIELPELSKILGPVAASLQDFGDSKGFGALRDTAAALQLTARAFSGNAAESKTAFQGLLTSIIRGEAKLKSIANIDVKRADGTKKSAFEIIKELGEAKKRLGAVKILGILGDANALKSLNQLTKNIGKGRNELDELSAATNGAKDSQVDFADKMSRDSQRVRVAINKFKNTATRAFLVVVKILGALIKNSKFVLLVIYSLVSAMLILKLGAVSAALASAAAWVAALAPFLLIAAGIAALILIVEDLYTWFRGGDSVLKALYQSAVNWVANGIGWVIESAVAAWRTTFRVFFGWVGDQITAAWARIKKVATAIKNFFKGDAKSFAEQVIRQQQGAAPDATAGEIFGGVSTPTRAPTQGVKVDAPQFNMNLTINGAEDATDSANKARDAVQLFFDEQTRAL